MNLFKLGKLRNYIFLQVAMEISINFGVLYFILFMNFSTYAIYICFKQKIQSAVSDGTTSWFPKPPVINILYLKVYSFHFCPFYLYFIMFHFGGCLFLLAQFIKQENASLFSWHYYT